MHQSAKYVIITPVRDEETNISFTIESVIGQTILPAEWVIVNDGSSDRTGEIIDHWAKNYPWIRAIHRANRGFRKSGGGVVEAFYEGYRSLRSKDWEFMVKLDGDLTFSADYFEKCLTHFEKETQLGIGGGDIYNRLSGQLILEANPGFHVRGATKIYRRTCWEAIGGLLQAPGWDTVDEVKANMLGWVTHSFNELHLVHHRVTGAAEGLLRDRVKHGIACYIAGYHPAFVFASCLYRLNKKPYLIGSAGIAYGFLKGYFTGIRRVNDPLLIKYVRTQQMRRLCGLQTIWK